MKSFARYAAVAVVFTALGFHLGAAPSSHASEQTAPSFAEEVEAAIRATVMALSSLAVDTEINARNIAEMNGRLARMERELKELGKQ